MSLQALPRSASSYAADQRTEIAAAVSAVRRVWGRMGSEFDASWLDVGRTLEQITATAQRRVAAGAQVYIPAVLAETGQDRAVEAFADVSTEPLIGVAGDGRPVDSLLYNAVTNAKAAVGAGASPTAALAQQSSWLTLAVGTVLSDTGRASESLAMGVRPIGGYVRMLNPPSCSRCAVLAGKWSRKSVAFLRHPGCDCRNIPASESVAQDLTVDPISYFDSLSDAEADRIFTKAGAEAIRNGADLNQVVNARRGMRAAQLGTGHTTLITTEGTTRRGIAFRALADQGTLKTRGARYTSAKRPRLMPETIQRVATDREDYLRLLRANGYIY